MNPALQAIPAALALPELGPQGWAPRVPQQTTLSRCVVLAALLHGLLLVLFGTLPGGTAAPGEGVWSRINVTLRGAGMQGTEGPATPLPDVGAPGAARERRWGGVVRTPEQQRRPEEGPGAVREGPWAPVPSESGTVMPTPPPVEPEPAPAPMPTLDMPRSTAPAMPLVAAPPLATPAMALPAPTRVPESLPSPTATLAPLPRLAPPTPAAELAPLSAPTAQVLPLPQTGVRAITPPVLPQVAAQNLQAAPVAVQPVELPAFTVPSRPALASPLAQPLAAPSPARSAAPALEPLAAPSLPATAAPAELPRLPGLPAMSSVRPLVDEPSGSRAGAPARALVAAAASSAPSAASAATPAPPAVAAPAAPTTTATATTAAPAPTAAPATGPAAAATPAASPAAAAADSATRAPPAAAPAVATAAPAAAGTAPGATGPAQAAPVTAGRPDAGARAGADVATPPSAPASAPRPPLDLRLRGGEMGRDGSRALLNLLPPPPERKSKLAEAIEKSAKKDCREAYAGMGILAVVPLVIDATKTKDNCKW